MAKREGGLCYCHTERKRSQLLVEIGMLCGYINVLIGEMRGHRMPVPPAPYIPSKDPPIRRRELKYMPVPLRPVRSWGYFPLDDWPRGPVPDQVPLQASRYAQVLQWMVPILLQVLLWVMMPMTAVPSTLQVILSEMMTFPRPAMYCCTMMM